MIELMYSDILIEAHRNDLRKLYHSPGDRVQAGSIRQTIGRMLVRFGYWIGHHRPEFAESSIDLSTPPARP